MFVYTPNNTYDDSYLLAGYSVANDNFRKSFIRFKIPELGNCSILLAELLLTTLSASSGNTSEAKQVGVYQLLEPFGNLHTLEYISSNENAWMQRNSLSF